MNNGIINWSPGVSLEAVEQQVIQRAFEHFRGNKTTTANALGISIRTLDSKLERYQQEEKEREAGHDRAERERSHQLARARGITPSQSVTVQTAKPHHDTGAAGTNSKAGLHMEPAMVASAELAVSVPERGEVQEVLPPKAAQGGNRRGR